ncbi:MAG: hypothetical protein NTV33_12760 [Coprothermobacterota bacterium]|nr:hypothetical protein [Coprothermobacterota bacterium]
MEEFRFILGRRVLIVLLSLVVLMGALVAMPAAGRALAARPSPVDQEASAASADPVADEAPIFAPSNTSIIVNSALSTLVQEWHTFYGSEDEDRAYSVTADSSGYIYAVGRSFNTWNGPGTATPLHAHSNPGEAGDFFVLKLTPDGSYIWHTFYGVESGPDLAYSVVTDTDNNVYVTGFSYQSWSGPLGQEPKHPFSGGDKDVFVLKLDSAGTYQWHTLYGSSENDWANGIDVINGNVGVAGFSGASWNGPVGQSPRHTYSGDHDIMILMLDSAGAYQWHTFYGSDSAMDYGLALAHDNDSVIHITGRSYAGWQGDGGVEPEHAFAGGADLYILELTSTGTYQKHTFYGSAADDWGQGIAFRASGGFYLTGYSAASWLGAGGTSPLHTYAGGHDIFVLAYPRGPNPLPGMSPWGLVVLSLSLLGLGGWCFLRRRRLA